MSAPAQGGVDIYEPVTLLAGVTGAATLSGSGYTLGSMPTLPAGSVLPSFLAGAIPTLAATNAAGFTIDGTVPLDLTHAFAVQTLVGAPLKVADTINVESGGALSLTAAGALAIDAPINARGAASLALG